MALIDPTLLNPLLGPVAGRLDVDSLDLCDSTNTQLMARAGEGAPSGTVLVADGQTAGRGRRGRVWLSAPSDSLTFSLLWRITGKPEKVSGLSLAVGLAMARALAELGVPGVGLKWPNDLLLQAEGRQAKLAGILIELAMDRRGTQAVIGIGLNLRPPQTDVGQPVAGLATVLSPLPERHYLLASLLRHLVATLDQFCAEGFSELRESWQALHAWQGQRVQVVDDGQAALAGTCLGVDAQGALLIDTPAGVQRLLAGEVSVRPQG